MGQSSGSVGPAIGGSPFGGLRVLSPMDIARASPQYDPYTASRRPNYMAFGPNQQFYQPIYQPSYSQFSPMGYGQAPFGGFYQQPMLSPQTMQSQYRPIPFMNQTQPSKKGGFFKTFRGLGQTQQQSNNYDALMTPQPMQSQYRPIPFMNQTQMDAKAQSQAADAAAAAAAHSPSFDGGGFKKGGGVEEGIDSLLRK